MIANYHTHTWRCNHASGSEEEYVKQAIKAGLRILGFSDHSPYLFPEGYYSSFRMRPELLEDYIATVRNLGKKYADVLEMPVGVELEYYPRHFGELMAYLQDHDLDYAILGQHFIDNEYDARYSGLVTDDRDVVQRYCAQSMEAMQTGVFTYFAHPDLIHYRGDRKFFVECVRPMCREAKSCGIPLELNLLGIRENRHYPNRLFWEVAAEEGCATILGCDAHTPDSLNRPDIEAEARALTDELGLRVIDTVELRPIRL